MASQAAASNCIVISCILVRWGSIQPPLKSRPLASSPIEERHFSNSSTWGGIFVLHLSKQGTPIYFFPNLHTALVTKVNALGLSTWPRPRQLPPWKQISINYVTPMSWTVLITEISRVSEEALCAIGQKEAKGSTRKMARRQTHTQNLEAPSDK